MTRTTERIREGRAKYLWPSMRHLYAEPLTLDRGEGVWVWDTDGREYLDLYAGILTTSLGHCHPRLIEAVEGQARRLGHVSTLYETEPHVEAARRVADLAPGGLERTFFTNSGTEAIETAVFLARAVTGRREVVALRGGYHGRSALGMGLTAHPTFRSLPAPANGVVHARAPYPYRCPFRRPCDETCVDRLVEELEEVIVTTTDGRPAALLAETIQGVSGYIVPPQGYLRRAAELVRSYGGLFIADEVQAGLGRTGSHWFGVEHDGVVPDILVMAKGLAGGFPAGSTTTTDEIAQAWSGNTISTFGGNPVAMAALSATLDVLVEHDAPTNAEARGRELWSGLEALRAEHPWIGEVRGKGLMVGMEVVRDRESRDPDPDRTAALVDAAREEGLLVGAGGLHGNVIRIGPSLLISAGEVAEGVERMVRACARVSR
ncbi:MAG: aspartate aminotransferase family protein [Gemmatimonadota bacterium]|nr:aspartate aminotransferase family protein [Gemmatimonadota bacterium]